MGFNPEQALAENLEAHGVLTTRTAAGLSIAGSDCVLSAGVVKVDNRPNGFVVQVDFRAFSSRIDGKWLIESCAGFSVTEEDAARMAFEKNMRASLHVLLATLVDSKYGADQVEWESWSSGRWRICLGPLCCTGSPPEELNFNKLLNELETALLPSLNGGSHWLRLYFMQDGSSVTTSEALLDNFDWPEAREIVNRHEWPHGQYSARLFLMLMRP